MTIVTTILTDIKLLSAARPDEVICDGAIPPEEDDDTELGMTTTTVPLAKSIVYNVPK